MRTTVNIDDDAYTVIKKYAEKRRVSFGKAVSDLVHRGAETLPRFNQKNGWVVFELPQGTLPLPGDVTQTAEKAEYEEEYRRAISPRR